MCTATIIAVITALYRDEIHALVRNIVGVSGAVFPGPKSSMGKSNDCLDTYEDIEERLNREAEEEDMTKPDGFGGMHVCKACNVLYWGPSQPFLPTYPSPLAPLSHPIPLSHPVLPSPV